MDPGDILSRTWELYRAQWRHLIAIAAVIYVPLGAVSAGLAVIGWPGVLAGNILNLAAIFPVQGALRYFRPASSSTSIATYKGRLCRDELPRFGVVVATLDNEPANCNAFSAAAPRALHVFLDTRYPDDSPALLTGIETIAGWR